MKARVPFGWFSGCTLFGIGTLISATTNPSLWAGQWTVRGPDIVGVDLKGIAHTPAGFFAVGAGGTVAKSITGGDWSVSHLYPRDWLCGVEVGAGITVAVGWHHPPPANRQGVIWNSHNGSQWRRVMEDADGPLTRVAHGNGRFVAVGGSGWLTMGGVTATSTDGISWVAQWHDYPVSYLKDVVFVEDHFLYAANSGVFTSTNGTHWTDTGAGLYHPIGLAVRGSTVVVVGRWGAVMISTNGGQSWEDADHADGGWFMDVGAGPDLFVAVGDQGYIATSTNGWSWTAQDSGLTALLEDVAYGDGTWVAVGRGGAILQSNDGLEWTPISSPAPNFSDVLFAAGRFLAVGEEGMLRSADGISWEWVAGQAASSVACGNGVVVAVGETIQVSEDGLAWTLCSPTPPWPLSRVVYGGGQFVAVGGVDALNYAESVAYRSSDGTNWVPVSVSSIGNLDSLAYVDGVFLAHTSFYGMTEAIGVGPQPPPAPDIPPGGLAGGHAGLMVVERSGYVSVGGNRTSQPLADSLCGCGYADGRYFAFGGGFDGGSLNPAMCWVSEDGINWRDLSPPTDRALRAVSAGQGHLIVVGDGLILERLLDDGLLESPSLTISAGETAMILRWWSNRGHRYNLEGSSTFDGWEPILDQGTPVVFHGSGGQLTWQFTPQEGAKFYRLQVAPE